MYTILRRSCNTIRPLPVSLSRSFSLSTRISSPPQLSLSERLRQRRQGTATSTNESDTPRDAPPHLQSSPSTDPQPESPSLKQGNLPLELSQLTERAIQADPVMEAAKRKEQNRERKRVEKLKQERKDRAKRVIELKKRAEKEKESSEPKSEATEKSGKGKESTDSLANNLRRRMGFSNPGRETRDRKKSMRIARLAAGGELTEGEKEKLATLQTELTELKKKRARMVPWDRLSRKVQKMEFYKVEKRMKRDEERKSQQKKEPFNSEPMPPTPSASSSTPPPLPPPPSATFDESISSATPSSSSDSSEPLSIIHHGSTSPYSAPTAPSPVIPSASDLSAVAEPPLSKSAQARLEKAQSADAARRAWTMRRTTIDRDIKDLEAKIATYQPPPHLLSQNGTKGPDVPTLEPRTEPPLMDKFVDQLQITNKGGKESTGSTEEAAKMLMEAVEKANKVQEEAGTEPDQPRRGRFSPRMEREERLRIARSRPYQDHPALQPVSSTHERPPPRELSSYPNIVSPSSVPFAPTPSPLPPVPVAQLSHSLERALFNPGVHFLQDPRSGVYNFPPEILENVPKLDEFEFSKLPKYVTSSKDEVLQQIAKREGKLFSGSTSSTVGMLCQVYFWLSKGTGISTSMLSDEWAEKDRSFSMGQQLPVSVILNYNESDGTYAIDADKSFDATSESNVLSNYGHLMEKLLTTEPKEFKRFLVGAEDSAPSEADHCQAYHYATTENMVLRSQLDAVNGYLPGNGTFDLKTRGTVAIRQDRLNYEESAGYKIDKLRGPWESFEREYYDLIRSAFLKYQFQARIGCMDGIFVAYHSTAQFYGFQYLPISEMDEALFENHETGKQVFKLALGTLEKLLKEATECYEGETVNVTFAADTSLDVLRMFVTPVRSQEKKEEEEEEDGKEEVVSRSPMTLLEIQGTNYIDGNVSYEPVIINPRPDGEVPVWQVGYEIKKTTEDTDDSRRIAELFSRVRETQQMFSSLMLPTGVSAKDVKAAAERAKETGVELDPSDLSIRFPSVEGMTYRGPSMQARDLRKMSREGKERTRLEEKEREGGKLIVVRSTLEVLE
ncbi:uncharacterized protein JCM6883_007321 [Sporobolomyces salmoneus]|uniref:uncharacterized protein n=1 Tax=Sporobolomyces salmoneus TaxID=183962 RepID=UPI003174EC26